MDMQRSARRHGIVASIGRTLYVTTWSRRASEGGLAFRLTDEFADGPQLRSSKEAS